MTASTGFLLGVIAVLVVVLASLIFAKVASINENGREQAEADEEQAEYLRQHKKKAAERRKHMGLL